MNEAPPRRRSTTTGDVDRKSEPKNDADLKNRQHRLFLLSHASNCTAEIGKCKHVYCPEMKDLLKHMASCGDGACGVRHCVRSRVLMNHFRRCRDDECGVCGPVHEALMDEYWDGTKRKLSFWEEHCNCVKRKLTF